MKKNSKEKEMEDQTDDLYDTRMIEKLTDGDDEQDPSADINAAEPLLDDLQEHSSARKETFSFLRSMAVFAFAFIIVSNFIVMPIQIQGSSMYPTLEDQSSGFSNLLGKETSSINRFDVVIIQIKNENMRIVKRVIGLPGETVFYQNGKLYINGEYTQEDFLDKTYVDQYQGTFMTDVTPVTLGADEYYCLGDNRPHSTDSRYYGSFKAQDIASKGVFIIFPFDQFGVRSW
jgi:signal peptidase I